MRILLDAGRDDVRSLEVDEATEFIVIDGVEWRLAGFVADIGAGESPGGGLRRYVPVSPSR